MKYLLLLLFILPCFTYAQKQFIIYGNIKSIPDKTDVLLVDFNGTDTLAKDKVENGSFKLKGKVDNTDARMILFPSLQRRMVIFMGNDTVTVRGSSEFSDIDITGSPVNNDYDEFMYNIKPLNDYVDYYRNQLQAAATPTLRDSLAIMLNTSYNIYQSAVDRFITRKKNSPVAALVLAYSYDTDPNRDVLLLEKRFKQLEPFAMQSQFAKNLSTVIEHDKIGAVGTKAIDFTQKDTTGKTVKLSQFKGRYVLVDFWASWCKPCRMENPNVVAAYQNFKNKNFTVLGVSLDKDAISWKNAIAADGLAWTQVSDLLFWDNKAARAYNITSIPHNILVDPSGMIIAKNLRGDELMQKLNQLVK